MSFLHPRSDLILLLFYVSVTLLAGWTPYTWGHDEEVFCCGPTTPNLAVALIANTWGSGDRPSVSGAWLLNLWPGWQVALLCPSGQRGPGYFLPRQQWMVTRGSWRIETFPQFKLVLKCRGQKVLATHGVLLVHMVDISWEIQIPLVYLQQLNKLLSWMLKVTKLEDITFVR